MTARMTLADLRAQQAKAQDKRRVRNARACTFQGEKFRSQRERNRWIALRDDLAAGQITDLRREVSYELLGAAGPILTPTGRVMRYVCDFVYLRDGREVREDAKGHQTELSAMKLAVMAAQGLPVGLV